MDNLLKIEDIYINKFKNPTNRDYQKYNIKDNIRNINQK